MGFTYEEAAQLRRIEMTLQRWAETECGNSNDWGAWGIERDETTGKPFMVRHTYRHGKGENSVSRYAVADREMGALRRLDAIMAKHPDLRAYHQSDPRGCALYVMRYADLWQDGKPLDIDANYTRGLAVAA
jgi:hypothetical protein